VLITVFFQSYKIHVVSKRTYSTIRVAYTRAFVLSWGEIRPRVGILSAPPVYLNNAQQSIRPHPRRVKDSELTESGIISRISRLQSIISHAILEQLNSNRRDKPVRQRPSKFPMSRISMLCLRIMSTIYASFHRTLDLREFFKDEGTLALSSHHPAHSHFSPFSGPVSFPHLLLYLRVLSARRSICLERFPPWYTSPLTLSRSMALVL
ncbi:hypothetical protein EV421DRAFT_1823346, partial [Armillaria borealis]